MAEVVHPCSFCYGTEKELIHIVQLWLRDEE